MSRHKYPRTPHLPFSPGCTSDDKILKNLDHLLGQDVVITMKMDGENTSLYRDGFHARSLDSRHHPSRDWLAQFHGQMAHDIPEGWRICGENLFARHSLGYTDLPSYFMGFSVWNEKNIALGWDETQEYFELLGIESVPTLFRGTLSSDVLKELARGWRTDRDEGFVVRLAGPIAYEAFSRSVAKWVRPAHVQTGEHWMHSAVVANQLKVQVERAVNETA